MKRYFITLIALVLVFIPACCQAEKNITMEQVVDANTRSVLCEAYGSFLMDLNKPPFGEYSTYYDAELQYAQLPSLNSLIILVPPFDYILTDDMQTYETWLYNSSLSSEMISYEPREEIVECSESDGRITLITNAPMESVPDEFLEYIDSNRSNLSHYEIVYILDAQTLAVHSIESSFIANDGTQIPYAYAAFTYGVERSDTVTSFLERLAAVQDSCNLTLVVDPDTDQEEVIEAKIPMGDKISLSLPESYPPFYLDRECTQSASAEYTVEEDMILYTRSRNTEATIE